MLLAPLPARTLLTSVDVIDDPDTFPLFVGQSFIAGKTPIWSTRIATSASGRERRQAAWSYPKWQFKLQYDVLFDLPSAREVAKLFAFFNAHQGQHGEFAFFDPTDNCVADIPFGTGDGITTTFQLTKTTTFGGITFTEPVLRVVEADFTANDASAAATIGDYGVITFASAPAAGAVLRWSGRFAYQVRFADDQLEAVQMMQGLWSQSGLTLLSIKR